MSGPQVHLFDSTSALDSTGICTDTCWLASGIALPRLSAVPLSLPTRELVWFPPMVKSATCGDVNCHAGRQKNNRSQEKTAVRAASPLSTFDSFSGVLALCARCGAGRSCKQKMSAK